ncbi:MAG: phenylalanine--tRNA ligase subunit beta [Myxococcota bacterium]
MRLPLDWLAEWIDLPGDDAIVERLSLCGFEDTMVHAAGPDLSDIVVGAVTKREPHPNADKLSVCTVDVGDGEARTIVCGAPNVDGGQKVAVALPGTRLPDGTKLKRSKLRGVVSEGMICSQRELGLGDEHQGIWVLDASAPVGASLPSVLSADHKVLEVGITPNRGDTASVLGLAREIRAIFGGQIREPESAPEETGAPAADAVSLSIEAGDGCFHYVARVVRGVTVGPSPDWLRARLEAADVRSINNVVDVTNLVLLERGQPLHAFDLAKLRGGRVVVRRAGEGEPLTTLDGQERKLLASDLVIADAEGPIALAGVMGGADSEVGDATRDVLIESAHFHPTTVRRTAKRLGLHSEASYRFERGVDAAGVGIAADRAARLLAELAGGQVASGTVEARGDDPGHTGSVALPVAKANRLLGTDLSADQVAGLLERVGVSTTRQGQGDDATLVGRIPSHRNDLTLPEDLIEEVARIHGYENIPTTLPVGPLMPAELPAGWVLADRAKTLLAAQGLIETMTFPFIGEDDLAGLRLEAGDPRATALRLRNPIQERDGLLRPLLLPSLLRVAHQNRSRQVDRVAIFEVCRVFIPKGKAEGDPPVELADEPLSLGALLIRGQDKHLWSEASPPPLFHELRGVTERLLTGLGYMASLRSGGSATYLHPGAQAEIVVAGKPVGSVGELHPGVAATFEIDVSCAWLELNLGALAAAEKKDVQFREVSREPSIRRDVAALLERSQPAGEVLEAIRKACGNDLVSVELFDRYEGRGVPEGRVSLAFRLVFQRADRTLSDAEIGKSMDRVVRMLTNRFGAELR